MTTKNWDVPGPVASTAIAHPRLELPTGTSAGVGADATRVRWAVFRSRSLASRWYCLPMLAIVALVVGLAASAFARAPVPPGVDPGHWLSISYGYVGLPAAPDPTDHVLFYPPLLFPFLGALVLATGNPLLADAIFAVALYALYGLSVIYVARRYLGSGPLQVALVGLGVLGGTTVQMLFWGGYPNLLGFALMNTTLVLFLGFVRTQRASLGAAMYLGIGLTYFAHELSFVLLMAALGLSGIFLLLLRKLPLRFLLRPVNILGFAGVVTAIGAYSELTARLGISHPSYFLANPSAYYIDEVGELFAPLAHAPAAWPAGSAVYLPPIPTAVLLAVAPLVAFLGVLLARRWAPTRVDARLVIGAGWLGAVLAVPGAGYLVHFDTDYSRFLYFLPLPFFLVVLLAVERAFATQLLASDRSVSPRIPAPTAAPPLRPRPEGRRPVWVAAAAVSIVLGFVFLTVTVPTVQANETSGTASAHDAAFLQATGWLKQHGAPGSVLTVPSAARWTEALTNRNAYTIGPVWLLFDPFQVTEAQESYWALSSQDVLANNASALSFSGFSTPVISQAPMYTAYVEGIPFPILRILPGGLLLNASGPNGTHDTSLPAGTLQLLPPSGTSGPTVMITYSTRVATVVEVGSTPSDGSARVTFRVLPTPGVTVHSLSLALSGPPSNSPTLDTDSIDQTNLTASGISLTVSGKLGESPVRAHVTTSVGISPAPRWSTAHAGLSTWTAVLTDPNGSAPFDASVRFSSSGTGRPNVVLPPSMDTADYLTNHSIAFLLWPNRSYGSVEITYYEATFGFRTVFQNAEWIILGR
jgi:hypothetical protein